MICAWHLDGHVECSLRLYAQPVVSMEAVTSTNKPLLLSDGKLYTILSSYNKFAQQVRTISSYNKFVQHTILCLLLYCRTTILHCACFCIIVYTILTSYNNTILCLHLDCCTNSILCWPDAIRIGINVYLRDLNRDFMPILSPLMVITQTLYGALVAIIGLIRTIFGSVLPIIGQLQTINAIIYFVSLSKLKY